MKRYKTALAAIVSTALMATTPAWAGGKENGSGAGGTAATEIGGAANASTVTGSLSFIPVGGTEREVSVFTEIVRSIIKDLERLEAPRVNISGAS